MVADSSAEAAAAAAVDRANPHPVWTVATWAAAVVEAAQAVAETPEAAAAVVEAAAKAAGAAADGAATRTKSLIFPQACPGKGRSLCSGHFFLVLSIFQHADCLKT